MLVPVLALLVLLVLCAVIQKSATTAWQWIEDTNVVRVKGVPK
jgi:hypothetical protein